MRLARAAASEAFLLWRLLREPPLWLLLLLLAVLGALAYRLPFAYDLNIGGDRGLGTYDSPYLIQGFNIEPESESATSARAFRWAFEHARLRFPGVGAAAFAFRLAVAAGQGGDRTVASVWSLSGRPLIVVPLAPGPRSYDLLLPPTAPDVDLRVRTPPFQPPGDSRQLAFAADRLHLASLVPPAPAWPSLAWLAGSLGLEYLLLRRWGLSLVLSASLGGISVALLTLLLITQRLGLTTFAPRLLVLLLLAYLLTIMLEPLLGAAALRLFQPHTPAEVRSITALVVLAFVIRLGGLLHPQSWTSDLGLHSHNLEHVGRGEVIFTENLPGEAGGGPAPYPPAQYIMLLPWRLGASSERVVQLGNCLADSLMLAGIWLLLRSFNLPAGAGLFAGALYLFAMPLLSALSKGEMANVWGQALVSPLALALGHYARHPRRWSAAPVLLVATLVAFLGHFGVFLSLVLFLGTYLAMFVVARRPWRGLVVVVSLALGAAVLLYYSAFVDIVAARDTRSVPFGVDRPLRALWFALRPAGGVGPVTALLGAVGLAILLRSRATIGLGLIVLAWWSSTLLSLGSLLWTEQALRWEAFLFPALALGGGVALDALWRLGMLGRLFAGGLLALILARGMTLWYIHLLSYR